jgi:uncharacterized protein YbjT (DUF2867 family)
MKNEQTKTKIVVIGGTGLIGSKVIANLRARNIDAVAASPDTGVNTLTGEGLAEVLQGASVVVDVSNSPSFEDSAVMNFFTTSTKNLLKYEAEAGVGHHIALSVVGTERLSESGYMRAKMAQEKLIKESNIPYTLVHSTQFFEFIKGIADAATDGDIVHIAPVLFQPISADDAARAVAKAATDAPQNTTIEVAGPEPFRMDDFIAKSLTVKGDPRTVVSDPNARYFGALLEERTLVPGNGVQLADTRFESWFASQQQNSQPTMAQKA